MSEPIRTTCPACHSTRPIRLLSIGHRVRCKQCAHEFRARLDDSAPTPPSSSSALLEPASGAEAREPEATTLHGKLRRALARLTVRSLQYLTAMQEPWEMHGRCAHYKRKVHDLGDPLDRAPQQHDSDTASRHGHEDARSELEQLRAAFCALRAQIAEAEARRPDMQTFEVMGRELESLRAQRDRLEEELRSVRSELDLRAAATIQQLTQQAEELEAARAERDRLREARHADGDEWERLRTQLGTLASSMEQAAARHDAGYHSLVRALDEARAQWETERHLQQEHDAPLRLIQSLNCEREQMTAFREQLKASYREAEKVSQVKIDELTKVLEQTIQDRNAGQRRGDVLAGQMRELRAELERQRRGREAELKQLPQAPIAPQQRSKIDPNAVTTPQERQAAAATAETAPAGLTQGLVEPQNGTQVTPRPRDSFKPTEADTRDELAIVHRDVALSQLGSGAGGLKRVGLAPPATPPRPVSAESKR